MLRPSDHASTPSLNNGNQYIITKLPITIKSVALASVTSGSLMEQFTNLHPLSSNVPQLIKSITGLKSKTRVCDYSLTCQMSSHLQQPMAMGVECDMPVFGTIWGVMYKYMSSVATEV